MTVNLNPYLSFRDNAREAMTFYNTVFGGTLEISTFADVPMPGNDGPADGVMHAMLNGDNGIILMGADTPPGMDYTPPTTSISLSGDDDATLRGYWAALCEGGELGVPLEVAPWGDAFGMVTDKFGIPWMVNISGAANAEG